MFHITPHFNQIHTTEAREYIWSLNTRSNMLPGNQRPKIKIQLYIHHKGIFLYICILLNTFLCQT